MQPFRWRRMTVGGLMVLVAVAALVAFLLRPQTTKISDEKVGTGAAVKAGDEVTVHYVGTFTDGAKFDSSLDRNQPFRFTVGQGMVIRGWDIGLIGMRVGGIRRLTVPPVEAYGQQGFGTIPANSTLRFEVQLLGIK